MISGTTTAHLQIWRFFLSFRDIWFRTGVWVWRQSPRPLRMIFDCFLLNNAFSCHNFGNLRRGACPSGYATAWMWVWWPLITTIWICIQILHVLSACANSSRFTVYHKGRKIITSAQNTPTQLSCMNDKKHHYFEVDLYMPIKCLYAQLRTMRIKHICKFSSGTMCYSLA